MHSSRFCYDSSCSNVPNCFSCEGSTVKFVNLTPHEIIVRTRLGFDLKVPPSGQVARVGQLEGDPQSVLLFSGPAWRGHYGPDDIEPCVEDTVQLLSPPTPGAIEGLPPYDPDSGIFYIVSSMVAAAAGGRKDVVAPDTGMNGAVRNDQGQIIATTRLLCAPAAPRPIAPNVLRLVQRLALYVNERTRVDDAYDSAYWNAEGVDQAKKIVRSLMTEAGFDPDGPWAD